MVISRETKIEIQDDLIARFGRASREQLVAEASAPEHRAHEWFTWDDRKAGHKCRLEEAGAFFRSIDVYVEKTDPVSQEIIVITGRENYSPPCDRLTAPGYRRYVDLTPRQRYSTIAEIVERIKPMIADIEQLSEGAVWVKACGVLRVGIKLCLLALHRQQRHPPNGRHPEPPIFPDTPAP